MAANDVLPGISYPLGATVTAEGVNFSVYSPSSVAMELLLFDSHDAARPARVISLDPRANRTFAYWHVFVTGCRSGQLYGYRAYGPVDPARGQRFDGTKVLLDPYARAVMYGDNYSRLAACRAGSNVAQSYKSVVVDPDAYDWEGDQLLRLPYASSVIYELHVGGFTRHPASGVAPERRGTYTGLIEKIPYLQALGVTAVELLPVQQFDEQDVPAPLRNYWGYNSVAFFAPHRAYSAQPGRPMGPLDDFRAMVKAFHGAGIEVILDVVFNHTAEGDERGPTLSFRGLENRAYYILDEPGARYANYTGCGNTFNGNHSVPRRLILDCLRYWVQGMHVDGFRFDLASVLARDEDGHPAKDPPTLWEIETDAVLASTKIIAEAWDAVGLYQVGTFIGHRWAEWNGQFRDDVRRFVRGDEGTVSRLAARLTGSRDLYPAEDREPNRSINFVACHDGYTLYDLVTYEAKHNEANGQDNRDGAPDNWSWNCGVEGPSTDPAVEALRLRQMKNLLAILLLSQGTPMLLAGDEVRRTQGGNNNAYCQDNAVSWFDWSLVDRNADLLRFFRLLIDFTQRTELFREERFWTVSEPGKPGELTWHGVRLNAPDWSPASHSLAFLLHDAANDERLHVLLNAYREPLDFELPPLPERLCWTRLVDTAQVSPADIADPQAEPWVEQASYRAEARSVVILRACSASRFAR
jgi:isoamylase